jgi:hypothetical protein
MIQNITQSDFWEETNKMFCVNIFPAKDPNRPYVFKNQHGETYDTYLVYDSKKTWRLGRDWRRIIKVSGVNGYYTINSKKAYRNLDQHDKDVIAYIDTNFPLPQ